MPTLVFRETETTGKGQILQLASVADYCGDVSFSENILRKKMLIEIYKKGQDYITLKYCILGSLHNVHILIKPLTMMHIKKKITWVPNGP